MGQAGQADLLRSRTERRDAALVREAKEAEAVVWREGSLQGRQAEVSGLQNILDRGDGQGGQQVTLVQVRRSQEGRADSLQGEPTDIGHRVMMFESWIRNFLRDIL